ncbi:MAG: hypothetical protein ACOX6L_06320 [Syntrophomonadaceae bacterium]
MRRSKGLRLLSCLVIAVFLLSGCGGSSGDTNWEYEKTIANPLKATCSNSEVKLGNLDKDGVEVTIPAGAFTEPTEVSLINPDKAPKYESKEMTGFGVPIEISAGEKPVRLQQPVTIKMKFNPAALGGADLESGSLYLGYFNGKQWQYIKPAVDRENNIMTFTTSHFSLFGQSKLTVDQRIEQYTSNKALADWAQKQSDEMTNAAAEKLIDHILQDKLGISDEATKGKVLGSLLKDDEWGGMLKNLASGDVAGFNKDLQVLAGKKIVENVPKSTLSKALGGLTSDFGTETVAKASEAAGYLAEGRTRDAARILGEHIADQFLITTAGKIAVAAIEHKISSWKNEEIEAAYQAYKKGASSNVPWWGYQVEKGNFDDVWSQMGGAARQLEIEAIAAQEKVRQDAGMPPLDDNEKEKIRTMVHKDLKKQFEQRVKTDAEIEKQKAEYDMIMGMYKESGFIEKGRWGWEKDYELEQRLDILTHFKDKLLKDTGRNFIKDGNGHTKDAISINELKLITMNWFGTDDPAERQRKYVEYLKKEFGIILSPKAELLNGQWSSASMTITEFDLGPAPEPSEDSESVEGCDLNDLDIYNMIKANLEEQKGKPNPFTMSLQLDANGAGNMSIISEDGDKTNLPATYKDGTLSATMHQEGAKIDFRGMVSEYGGAISASGSFNINLPSESNKTWIKGTWSAKK